MLRLLDRTSHGLAVGSRWLAVGTAVIMIVSLLLGVFFRYVVGASLAWSDEVARLAFTWTVFLLGSAAVRGDEHVRVTLLTDALPGTLQTAVERLMLALVAAFGVYLLWYGGGFAMFTAGQVSPAVRYPLWLRNGAVPVCGALVTVHALNALLTPQRRPHAEETAA